MSLATRCPACGTIFRVVQDQLKVSDGWVRCGQCQEVFHGIEALFDLGGEAPVVPAPTTTAASSGSPPTTSATAVATESAPTSEKAVSAEPAPTAAKALETAPTPAAKSLAAPVAARRGMSPTFAARIASRMAQEDASRAHATAAATEPTSSSFLTTVPMPLQGVPAHGLDEADTRDAASETDGADPSLVAPEHSGDAPPAAFLADGPLSEAAITWLPDSTATAGPSAQDKSDESVSSARATEGALETDAVPQQEATAGTPAAGDDDRSPLERDSLVAVEMSSATSGTEPAAAVSTDEDAGAAPPASPESQPDDDAAASTAHFDAASIGQPDEAAAAQLDATLPAQSGQSDAALPAQVDSALPAQFDTTMPARLDETTQAQLDTTATGPNVSGDETATPAAPDSTSHDLAFAQADTFDDEDDDDEGPHTLAAMLPEPVGEWPPRRRKPRNAPLPAIEVRQREAAARADPRFVREARRGERWTRPWVRASLGAMLVLLVLAAAAQVAWPLRDVILARWPATQPALARACEWMDCTLEAPRSLASLALDGSSLTRTDTEHVLLFSADLHNRSDHAVRMPSFDLSFMDLNGQIVARKVLAPSEIGIRQSSLGPDAELHVHARLQVTDVEASGFLAEMFYP